MDALRLAVLGLWQRRGVSVVLLLVAAAAVAAATAGPMYLRAGQQSLLRDTVAAAPAAASGIEVTAVRLAAQGSVDQLRAAVADSSAGLAGYGPPIAGFERSVQVRVEPAGQVDSRLVSRTDVCAHLALVRGRCPTAPGEVAVSVSGAQVLGGTAIGDRVGTTGFYSGTGADLAVTVVGVWQARDLADPYWFGRAYFVSLRGGGDVSAIDAMFTPDGTFPLLPAAPPARRQVNVGTPTEVVVDRLAQPAALRLQDVPALRHGLGTLPDRLHARAPDAVLQSFLPYALDRAQHDGAALRRPVALVTGQLLVLAWFVLYTVVAGATAARGLEVALAKLRGFPPAAAVAFALLETALVLLAAVPVGLAAGYVAVTVLARTALGPGVPVVVTGTTVLAAGAALAGALLAALLAAVRVVRQPVLTLLRRSTSGRRGLPSVVAEVLVLAGAVVALLRLARPRAGGDPTGALLAPGLFAVAAALVAARLLPLACRAAFGWTRDRQRVAGFLAVRQVARRPAGLRVVLVLGTAFGLATFAVVGDSVFAGNRDDRARAETGAARVLTVDSAKADVLLPLVRGADPGGRQAMAVVTYEGGTDAPVRLVGMDTSRLAAVPYWRADFATADARTTARLLQAAAASGPVPAMVGTEVDAPGGAVPATGLDGRDLSLDAVVRSRFVPRFGPRAAVADLAVLQARTTRPVTVVRAEVWLAPGAGAVRDRLRAAGLRVDLDEPAATRADRFGRQAPSLALDLFLAGAAAAAVLALGGTVLDLYLLGRRRAFEIAAMAGVGLGRGQLVAGVLVEQGLVLGTGAGIGVAAGLAAVAVTLPAIPEFSDRYSFPAIVLRPDPVFVAVLVAAVTALTAAGIAGAAVLLVRSAGPGRLREAQP